MPLLTAKSNANDAPEHYRYHDRCRSVGARPLLALASWACVARSDQQSFDVHLLEPPQSEPPHPVPLFGLGKQRFDPHLPLSHRLLVGLRMSVRPHPLHILFVGVAVDAARPLARRAPLLERAIPARRGICPVPYALTALAGPAQLFARRAQVEVPLRIVDELAFAEESLALTAALVRCNIRPDPHTLDRPHVFCGTVRGVAGHVMRQRAPAEGGPPQ